MKTKTILASKTFWLNLLALLALFWPSTRAWVAANPIEPVVALGALNVLLRFVTAGAVSLFGSDKTSGDADSGSRMLAVMLAGGLVGLIGFSLPACSPGAMEQIRKVPITACYIDEDGNKICYSTQDGITGTVDKRNPVDRRSGK